MSNHARLRAAVAICAFALAPTSFARAQQATEAPASPAQSQSLPSQLPPLLVEKPPQRRAPPKPKHASSSQSRGNAQGAAKAAPSAPKPAPTGNVAGADPTAYSVPNASVGTKTDTPILLTPATVTVVPQQVLTDQAVTTIQEAVRNAPGVAVGGGAANDSGQPYSELFIRGFPAGTFLRNGVRSLGEDNGVFSTQFADIDQVQVLQGPAAILYGAIEPGGVVNIITKQPLSTPYYSIEQQIGSYSDFRTSVDLTGPIGTDGTLSYRLTGSWQDQGSPFDYIFGNTRFLAPVVKWTPDASTTVTFEAELKNLSFGQNYGFFPYINGVPVNNNISTNWGLPSPENENSFLESLTWSHKFDNGWTIRQNFTAASDYTTAAGYVPNYLSNGVSTVSGQGVGSFTNQIDNNDHSYSTTLDLTGKATTGPVEHTLLFGADYYYYNSVNNLQQAGLLDSNISWVDLFNPNGSPATPFSPGLTPEINGWTTTNYATAYAQDQLTLPYNVHLLAGASYNFENQTSASSFAAGPWTSAPAINEGVVTPRFGALWQPKSWLSLYGSYTESFSPNQVGYVQPSGLPVPPSQGWQWEFGGKSSFFDDKLIATIAWYDLTKTNIPTPDLANPEFVLVTGQARSIGWEFALQGQLAPGWNVIANLALTNARVTQSDDPNNPPGAPLGDVPPSLVNLWTTYEWQEGRWKGFKIGGGVTHNSGAPYLEGGNSGLTTAPYTIFDAMASYTFNFNGVKWTAQINATNIFNAKYFQEVQGGGNYSVVSSPPNVTYSAVNAVWGMPRTVLASLKAEF